MVPKIQFAPVRAENQPISRVYLTVWKSSNLRGAVRQALFTAKRHRQSAFQVFEHAARITDHIQARAEKRKELEKAEAMKLRRNILLILLLALALSGLFVSLIVLDVRNMIKRLTEKMLAVSNGDLEVPDFQDIARNDMGTLYECFNQMNTILKKLAFFIGSAASATTNISASAHQLDTTADHSTHGAQQVASSLEELSAGTEEIATNLSVGFEELSNVNTAIQTISDSSANCVAIAKAAGNSALKGRAQTDQAIVQVNAIRTASSEVSASVSELLRLSSEIESIIGLMGNIADQTSMLSLNAAIEAARAGDQGRGFAVVAEEVGKLAGHSTTAADSVSVLVREVQARIEAANRAMVNGFREVDQGAMSIREVAVALEEVHEQARMTSKEVTLIADESAANIEGIAQVSQVQSAGAEQIFSSAKSLTTIVEELNLQLTSFRPEARSK